MLPYQTTDFALSFKDQRAATKGQTYTRSRDSPDSGEGLSDGDGFQDADESDNGVADAHFGQRLHARAVDVDDELRRPDRRHSGVHIRRQRDLPEGEIGGSRLEEVADGGGNENDDGVARRAEQPHGAARQAGAKG